jgi:hypothetical protein
MRHRLAIERQSESRAFVDEGLGRLQRSHWRPAAWAEFLGRCGIRSAMQARTHPLAAIEVTALHAGLGWLGWGGPGLAASWVLAMTHLGLLGSQRRSIGLPNLLSLLRANLPASRWTPLAAVGSDVLDGRLARLATPTAFGAYADPLADVVFWTRYASASDSSRVLRAAVAATWLLPLAAIVTGYFAAGRTIDYPRPLLVRRLSAAVQCLLAARALTGWSKE